MASPAKFTGRSINHPQHRNLRDRLQYIADAHADIGGVTEQITLISDLARDYPHSIRLMNAAVPGNPETSRFNCHQYAFGLCGSDKITRIATRFPTVFPGREYVSYLIDNILTEIAEAECRDGDFVVYLRDGRVEHSGIWKAGKIHSKWGLSHVWEHAPHEVPTNYGDAVRFFRRLPATKCVAAFVRFANRKVRDLRRSGAGCDRRERLTTASRPTRKKTRAADA